MHIPMKPEINSDSKTGKKVVKTKVNKRISTAVATADEAINFESDISSFL